MANNYSDKFTTAFLNMIKGLSDDSSNEGGTEVNEICQVKTNTSVNVRSGPGTSYNVVTSLTNGTQVTRIRKAVATTNGYTWDKIKLENGTVGYMANNYLVKIS